MVVVVRVGFGGRRERESKQEGAFRRTRLEARPLHANTQGPSLFALPAARAVLGLLRHAHADHVGLAYETLRTPFLAPALCIRCHRLRL